jgi:quercetin dioxygenase-like cupin family protein
MRCLKSISKQQLLVFGIITLLVTGCSSPAENNAAKETNQSLEQLAPNVFKLKADTLGLRCFEVTYKAGDSIPMNEFPENVLYVLEPGTIEYTREDGSKAVSEFTKGQAYIRGGGRAFSRNIGNTTIKGLVFQILRPNEVAMPYDATKDAAIVEPSIYQVLADTNNIRVIMATYQAGQTSKLHHHPDYISYVLEGGKTEIIEKDGSKQDGELIAGTSGVFKGSEHIFKNIDTVSWKVLMIEVNRKTVVK